MEKELTPAELYVKYVRGEFSVGDKIISCETKNEFILNKDYEFVDEEFEAPMSLFELVTSNFEYIKGECSELKAEIEMLKEKIEKPEITQTLKEKKDNVIDFYEYKKKLNR